MGSEGSEQGSDRSKVNFTLTQAVYTPARMFLYKRACACVPVHKYLHGQTHTGIHLCARAELFTDRHPVGPHGDSAQSLHLMEEARRGGEICPETHMLAQQSRDTMFRQPVSSLCSRTPHPPPGGGALRPPGEERERAYSSNPEKPQFRSGRTRWSSLRSPCSLRPEAQPPRQAGFVFWGNWKWKVPDKNPRMTRWVLKLPLLPLGPVILHRAGSFVFFLFFLEHQSWLSPG